MALLYAKTKTRVAAGGHVWVGKSLEAIAQLHEFVTSPYPTSWGRIGRVLNDARAPAKSLLVLYGLEITIMMLTVCFCNDSFVLMSCKAQVRWYLGPVMLFVWELPWSDAIMSYPNDELSCQNQNAVLNAGGYVVEK
jgi:hypothetical protein